MTELIIIIMYFISVVLFVVLEIRIFRKGKIESFGPWGDPDGADIVCCAPMWPLVLLFWLMAYLIHRTEKALRASR